MRCSAITKAGERCKGDATHGSYCWSHAPETAELRKRNASRGGRSGGNGRTSGTSEMVEVKREIRRVIRNVQIGEVDRGVGAVAFQGYNCLLKALEIERKIKEQEEVLERIEVLEERQRAEAGAAKSYGQSARW